MAVERLSHNKILYQIYPRSFKDSNHDGVGDLPGITEKLDYLVDLGVNAIWLSPIYKSPDVDFGYDVSDYKNIDQIFGNLEDFDVLKKSAHRRGLKVYMDFVLNHTSVEHPWFRQSRSSKKNEKRDWYIWHDPVDGHAPNNWMSVFEKSSWALDQTTGQYYFHSFLTEQPDLNWSNLEVKDAMKDIMRFWFDRGIDGFRLDAANFIWKQKHFKNEPVNPKYNRDRMEPFFQLSHIYSKDQDETFAILNELGDVAKEYGDDKFLILEAYPDERGTDAIETYMKYHNKLKRNVLPFNFEFLYLNWSAQEYKQFIDKYLSASADTHTPIFVFGNHDVSRIASRIGDAQARVAAMLLFTLPGISVIYYGEELGMTDVPVSTALLQDKIEIYGQRPGRDPERTPMQWTDQVNSGFTQGKPWLPVAQDYQKRNVETGLQDSKSMLSLYKKLIGFRKSSETIQNGKYVSLEIENQSIYGYIRQDKEDRILVVLNFSDNEQLVKLPFDKLKLLFTTLLDQEGVKYTVPGGISLRSNEGCIFSI